MPFGADPFGAGLFGDEPEQSTVRYVPVAPPAAIFLDAFGRDAVLDELGRFLGMDTDDQQVAISFMVARGTAKHAPEVGHDFMTLPRITGAPLQAECERRAAAASPFDTLLASGAAKLLSVTVVQPKRGEARITISYQKRAETIARSIDVGTS